MKQSLVIGLLYLALNSIFLEGDEFKSSFPEYTRTWVGPDYWSNRLQDWRVTMGRLECLNGELDKPMRTTLWISGEVGNRPEPFTLTIRTGSLGYYDEGDGSSWSGLLIGAGQGKLDYRSASLIHHLPSNGGGMLAVFDDQGRSKFLSNESERDAVRKVMMQSNRNPAINRSGGLGNHEDYRLELHASEERGNKRDLSLTVFDFHTGQEVSRVQLDDVDSSAIRGGVAFVSHGGNGSQRRYWFRDFRANGDAIKVHPNRRYGPILGTLYSVSGNTLKINAQFPPLGFGDASHAKLEIGRKETDFWREVETAPIESPSYTALFRVENFQRHDATPFRIRYVSNGVESVFEGQIAAQPQEGEMLAIVGLTCYQNIAKSADAGWGEGFFGTPEGRWTQENLWFPHTHLVETIAERDPSLIALLGDQIYEGGNPTTSHHEEGNPHLDYLYKWYITLWDLGRLTRQFPTVVLTDDHDVYQGDLWGNGGAASVNGQNKEGGYVHEPEFVRMVERTQTGGNPDPAPGVKLDQGLKNYFTSFSLADVDFALIEDRKFKSLPTEIGTVEKNGSKIIEPNYDVSKADILDGKLLGAAQETFLSRWAETNRDRVKIALTQTTYASLHTDPDGAKWIDIDSGGWPQSARNRALDILKQGNTILLSGDTHLPSVI